ncbi:MAG TPA: hypothetical protein VGY77_04115 [Gemmataceae bacterium]|jgi:hypothetical protein|nr:hypothetical protein [Gemmataceae bacterium]
MRRLLWTLTVLGLMGIPVAAQEKSKESPISAAARKKLQTKVTVDYTEARLQDIAEDLKKQVENLSIWLDNAGGVSNNMTFTYKAKDKSLAEVFDELFTKTDLGYVIGQNKARANYRFTGWIIIKKGKFRGQLEDEAAVAPKPPDKTPPKDQSKEKPPETKPGEKAQQLEQEAARKLKLAKMFAADGLADKAKARYKEIVEKYPGTKAAKEAQELLEK